jgi:hypothetical protein
MSVNIVSPGAGNLFLVRAGQAGDVSAAGRGSKTEGLPDRHGYAVSTAIQSDCSDLRARAAADFERNALALKIRGADRHIGTFERHVEEMKATLEGIVKNFPPFPEGSEERVRMLTRFKALRKQIESLTLPPPSDRDVFKLMVDSAPVLPGEVAIPELSEGATDEEIFTAIETLHVVKDRLENMRSGMMSDAMDAITFEKRYPGFGEELRENMSAEVAQRTSGEVREALAKEAGSSLAGAQSHLFVSVK